ncbi:TauD/TfdA family dioxygenase [Xenorhabdus sp. KJ12.1]|uniref:TauD/TfdA dioxygenase family protein n=1 Tax=Xenorhabdus sp. KJ12.1 TaxID=1851571 RepID=UPI000C04687C|nr:TauD/TfdA family dioxygenase [Xenorhabdus sp. KJ12.1]PHM68298.1 paerucumarin biosynthesis protein PvcB [Xenorhabdus sp. KJ12.1]
MHISELACHTEPITPFGVLITPGREGQEITSLPVNMLRELVRNHLLVVLRGFSSGFTDPKKLTEYSQNWGEIMMWPFGAVLDVMEQAEPSDHVLDRTEIPLHWDGMYRQTIPEFQIFHCVSAPAVTQGGRTTFVNTEQLIIDANEHERHIWGKIMVTYRTSRVTHYGGEVVSPLICLHPNGRKWVMRYNEPMAVDSEKYSDHHSVKFEGFSSAQQSAFEKELKGRLYAPCYLYVHQWQTNDVLISDNFTLLHGRESFVTRSSRHLQRVHIHGTPICNNTSFKMVDIPYLDR